MAWLSSWLPFRKLLRSFAISTAVAVLTALTVLIVSYLLFPVTGIEVRGARMFLESEAWEGVSSRASLLSLNSNALEMRIESNPWVKGARVLKDWDSGIVMVEVEERKAVLHGKLDDRRVVLAADGTELPGLGGASLNVVGLDEVQLEEIARLGEVLEENGIVLDSIDGVGAGGVDTTVKGRRVLFAGEVGYGQARALAGFMKEHPEASYFDLRSPNRVVIGAEPGTGYDGRPGGSDG